MMKFSVFDFKSVFTGKHSNMVRNTFLLLKWQKPSGMVTSLMLLLDLLVYIYTKYLRCGPYDMAHIIQPNTKFIDLYRDVENWSRSLE